MRWSRKWPPTPVLLPGDSQGRRSLVGCSPWGRTESDTTERLSSSSLVNRRGFLFFFFEVGDRERRGTRVAPLLGGPDPVLSTARNARYPTGSRTQAELEGSRTDHRIRAGLPDQSALHSFHKASQRRRRMSAREGPSVPKCIRRFLPARDKERKNTPGRTSTSTFRGVLVSWALGSECS